MKLLSYLPYIPDMQGIYVVRNGKTVFDGFAYELEDNELRNAEMFRLYALVSALVFEVY